MNKQELLENYTMEQLADMVIDLEKLAESETVLINNKADEIKELKCQLDRKETTINQIDDILSELFSVTHDVAKPEEFREILRGKLLNGEVFKKFMPEQPINIVEILINAKLKPWDCKVFNVSELRQIAEHLLVYCNANESEGD